MVCCGTASSRSASTKLSQSSALVARTSAWALLSSSASAVHENASTWPVSRYASVSSSTSEITGPWRVSRTVSSIASPPLTSMVSVRTSKGRLPSGAR